MTRAVLPLVFVLLYSPWTLSAQDRDAASGGAEGVGPFALSVIRGATVVDGTGGPPYGPADIWIAGNRIQEITSAGLRPTSLADHVLDASGCYVLPGLIDVHAHLGDSRFGVPADYQYRLWLGHGITSIRAVGPADTAWELEQKRLSALNLIIAPRIFMYAIVSSGPDDSELARTWARLKSQGLDGIKFVDFDSLASAGNLIRAAHATGLRVTVHNSSPFTVLELAESGLECTEHWYGLPEALSAGTLRMDDVTWQKTQTEAEFFRRSGTRWRAAYDSGYQTWPAVADRLIALGMTLVPTLSVYSACADVGSARDAPWQTHYVLPGLRTFFTPSREHHGSFWDEWSRQDEAAWRDNLSLWLRFLKMYQVQGGRVAVGTDDGFMYEVFGFGFVRHLVMLSEGGFSPLEVVRAATLNGAELLGMQQSLGSVAASKLADLVVVESNPLSDFAVLYEPSDSTDRPRGIRYTVKDGVYYDTRALLADVRSMVDNAEANP